MWFADYFIRFIDMTQRLESMREKMFLVNEIIMKNINDSQLKKHFEKILTNVRLVSNYFKTAGLNIYS